VELLRFRLDDDLMARLREQAHQERRRPQDQAAYILEKALRESASHEEREREGRQLAGVAP